MSLVVPRTCTVVPDASAFPDAGTSTTGTRHPLEHFRPEPAYVLLGDPGAGKTQAFNQECEALGEAAEYVSARDFLTFSPADHPEWHDRTLFIDGLDECRAGAPDKLTPFHEIRARLDALGRPRFRLSCRAADWLPTHDRRHLASVSPPDTKLIVLRLDPLTDSGVEAILDAHPSISKAHDFICSARARGVDGLLRNPQSLGLLVRVVARQQVWPATRLETFKQASRQLAAEHNGNHRFATQVRDLDRTLDAAGRMCAISLLTGAAGFASDPDRGDDDYLDIDCLGCDRSTLLRALSTNLFKSEPEGRFVPEHRHLAEFLAARHITRLIAGPNGLPAARVIALITGEGGTVVTEFRGLSAWLAALCRDTRPHLIKRDPIGVASYGDVRGFTTEEKRTLLELLSREQRRLHSAIWTRDAVGAFATPDMESTLREALDQRADQPYFAALVLLALTHGTPLPGLADFLFEKISQPGHWLQLPRMVLDAFIHNCPDTTTRDERLEQLLDDLTSGRVSDWNNELLGTVLIELYPGRMTPGEIWDHLSVTAQRFANGPYQRFWRSRLVESTSDIDCLLDSLAARRRELKLALENHELEQVPIQLLVRGIEIHGETTSTTRLCNWLSVDLFPELRGVSTNAAQRIGWWLEQRPDTVRRLIVEIVSRPVDTGNTVQTQVDQLLYGADFRADHGLWCLKQATRAADPPSARYFLGWSCGALLHRHHDQGLNLETMFRLTRDHLNLREMLGEFLKCPLQRSFPVGLRERRSAREERDRNHTEWIVHVRSEVDTLSVGRSGLDVMNIVGRAYFGLLMEARGGNPQKRIRTLFQSDTPLIDAALSGLRASLTRDDLPEPARIISLMGSGREFRLAAPFLAGMEELEPNTAPELDDRQVRQALAFHYCYPVLRTENQSPAWYQALLARSPETVADVLVEFFTALLHSGRADDPTVHQLLLEDHADVARRAALPILSGFPLRCAVPQLLILDLLLHTAHRYAEGKSFRDLIAQRLSLPSMTDAQRVHWLAMGAVVDPDVHLPPLQELVGRRERRVSHLADFLMRTSATIDQLTVPALRFFISLLGSSIGRWMSHDCAAPDTAPPAVTPFVYDMVQRLSTLPGRDASDALDDLASSPELASWHADLNIARDRQRVVLRDALYRHPTVDQVCRTLHDGPPANPARPW